jgi:hypothetical protein
MVAIKAIYFSMINMKFPGFLLDPESSSRLHRVFLYKFFRGSHAIKEIFFDKRSMAFSNEMKWKFNYSGPYLGSHFKDFVTDRSIFSRDFFQHEERVFIFEGGRFNKKNPQQFYCAKPNDVEYFFQHSSDMTLYGSDVLYVFGGGFDWFIHVRASLKPNYIDETDYIYQYYSKNDDAL